LDPNIFINPKMLQGSVESDDESGQQASLKETKNIFSAQITDQGEIKQDKASYREQSAVKTGVITKQRKVPINGK
jgi:hypothetical protein